jgi:ketosteroid isomerase-like protein
MKTKFKHFILIITIVAFVISCCQTNKSDSGSKKDTEDIEFSSEMEKQNINNLLDSFNLAAANADYDLYFSYYAEDAVFIGTDATENWSKSEFMEWSKPYFDRGKAWDFTSLQRNIYFDESGKTAWFDELLDTQMKLCRGSGVLVKHGNSWKIKQYVLSMTIPNSETDEIVKIKAKIEDKVMLEYR